MSSLRSNTRFTYYNFELIDYHLESFNDHYNQSDQFQYGLASKATTSKGTPCLKVFVSFKLPRRLIYIHRMFPNAINITRLIHHDVSSIITNIKKTPDYIEFGVRPLFRKPRYLKVKTVINKK